MKKRVKIILWSVIVAVLLAGTGWLGWTWYDNNVDRSGWREKNGVTVYADFHGKPVTGWLELDGSRYYFGEDHSLQTGWQEINGSTYYLREDGKMQTLWADLPEGRCYFGEDGILRTSWQQIGQDRYYFDEKGLMQSGWVDLENTRHYFRDDGVLASGWQKIEDAVYYFSENGTPATGWLQLEDSRYCFADDGRMFTGRTELDGKIYFFTETGAMLTGWLEDDIGRSYFLEDGAQASGWTEIGEKRFYFGEEGYLHTGWLQLGEYRYYLLPDGTAATGRQEIEGKTCYFTPKGIWVFLVNPWNRLPADYEVDLVEIEKGFYVDRQCHEALKTMMKAMRDEGLLPLFTSAYRTEAEQKGIWNKYVNRYIAAGYDKDTANSMTAAFVAVPGTSEHHTGLAVDIVGHDYFYGSHPGSTMAVQAWLKEHCWEYGFILRYTQEKSGITGFAAETWHFRYVGTEVSMDMKDSGLCLEEYLGAAGS